MGSETFFSKLFARRKDVKTHEQVEGLLRGPPVDFYTMYINKGEDDEMQLCCYKRNNLRTAIVYLLFILTGGLLRLIFHWVPHLYLISTSIKCKINEATKILITEIYNGKYKIYHVKTIQVLTPESVAKLKLQDDILHHHAVSTAESPPALSVHFENGEFRDVERLLMFNLKRVTYIWDSEKQEFVKLTGLDSGVSTDVFHRYKGITSTEHFMRLLVYGPNIIDIREQSVLKLLFLEILNPFYIFQIFSFALWFADNYYYYAITIMLMTMFGISMSVIQTRKNQKNLKSTVHSSDVCTVMRRVHKDHQEIDYETEAVSTKLLVPGDVIEIPSHGCIMHCDAILLTGNCILNESMLTGESVPVTKTALPNTKGIKYDPNEHGRHTLFCGTHVIQTRYFGNEKVLAVVVRTGFSTAKGNLVRSILYPPPVDFRFEKDSYRFVAFLGLIACLGFIYTLITKIMKGESAGEITLETLDLITITVPPALPAAMTVGRFYAQIRLKKQQIYCISPRSINISGSVDCVCFDKTGTLTEDGLDLLCVVPIEEKRFKASVNQVESIPFCTFVYGLASCHSLTIIDKEIVGDPLDQKMFESTKWILEEPEVDDSNKFDMIFPTVVKPPRTYRQSMDDINDLEIGIIREFPFSSSSQRMGVIIRRLNGTTFEYFCKGSPEMILNFVKNETVPDNFHDILESYTQEGYRVIALAHKELKLSYAKVQKVQREVIEKDLTLLGLIVMENRLKPDTTPCIKALNDAQIRVIMVTGDNILTALSVAKDCDIITPGQSIITINCDTVEPPNLYYTLTSTKNKLPNDMSNLTNSVSIMSLETLESQLQTATVNSWAQRTEVSRPNTLLNNYRFALTGKVWAVIRAYYPELLPRICTRGNIFARMAPDQKQQLVQDLQGLGYCVAMCGDGANDCGALRAAHTGISLSEAESSVASPFTSKNPNISCVLNVVREGRAALVTSFGIFKYMASYSLCQFISVLILYSVDSNLTDMEFLYIDLAIISVFAFFFGKTEAYQGKLVKETPLSSLVSLSPILSLISQIVLVLIFQLAAFQHLKSEPWFVPLNATDSDDIACVENYTIYTISSFQYIILAVVFSKGYPYRKSIFSNYGFIVSTIIMSAISIYLALMPDPLIANYFELVLPEDFNFRVYLLIYAGANFVISLLLEHLLIEEVFFKRLRFKFHNVKKSKRKYLAVERELNLDTKWPVLNSDFKSVASPLSPQPVCSAEIVIETENRFEKNHILNKLLETNVNSNPQSPKNNPEFHLDNCVGKVNDTGYISQEDLLFSSLPSETSPSDNFHSFSNNNDLTSSIINIPELPYDGRNSIQKESPSVIEDEIVSNFNSLGRSPPQNEVLKPLEMNNLHSQQ